MNGQTHRDGLLADESIEHWVDSYDLRRKVRCLPEAVPSLDTPEVAAYPPKSIAYQLNKPFTRSADFSLIPTSVQSLSKMVLKLYRNG